MLRRSQQFLETGTVLSWAMKKNFGFAAIGGDENNKIFIHSSAIVKPHNSRPLHTLRRGVAIQFDITKDDQGRVTAKNVTGPNGQTLSTRDEIPPTTVDIRSLRSRLVSDNAEEDDSRHGQAIKGIVQSLSTISQLQSRTANMNLNLFRLLDAMAEKEGIKSILAGDEYTEAKNKVMVNVIREADERRAKRAKGEPVEDDEGEEEDDEHVAADADPEEEKKSKKSPAKKAAAEKEKATVAATDKKDDDFHSADDLLDLMEDDEAEKKPKSKKGKK
eukprot:GILI01010225.1.p1 GENE.GILI01010225.1~~GILI01010225.1.p1  ORF type:complete len:294 (+),score=104.53 GILI01010225.1:58-882(+)